MNGFHQSGTLQIGHGGFFSGEDSLRKPLDCNFQFMYEDIRLLLMEEEMYFDKFQMFFITILPSFQI